MKTLAAVVLAVTVSVAALGCGGSSTAMTKTTTSGPGTAK